MAVTELKTHMEVSPCVCVTVEMCKDGIVSPVYAEEFSLSASDPWSTGRHSELVSGRYRG